MLLGMLGLFTSCAEQQFVLSPDGPHANIIQAEADSTYEYILESTNPATGAFQLLCNCKETPTTQVVPTSWDRDPDGGNMVTRAAMVSTTQFQCGSKTNENYVAYNVFLPVVDTSGNVFMWKRQILVPADFDIHKLGREIEVDGKKFKLLPGKATDEFQIESGDRKLLIKYHPQT